MREKIRELQMVKRVEYDDDRRELIVYFERGHGTDAESVMLDRDM